MKRLIVAVFAFQAVTAHTQVRTTEAVRLPPQISAVTLSPSSVTGGTGANGVVTLTQAAGTSGIAVKLASSNGSVAIVPASVTVQPGSTTANFLIQTYPVSVSANVVTDPPGADISAQIGTSTPKVARLTVLPPSFTAFSIDPASIPGSNPANGVVTISGPAPAGGFTIGLTVVAPAAPEPTLRSTDVLRSTAPVVTIPAQVVVPAGGTSAAFQIATRAVASSTTVQINATRGPFVTKTASLTVQPPGIASIQYDEDFGYSGYLGCTHSGESRTAAVLLTAPAPANGMTYPVSVADVSSTSCGPFPTVPATIEIPGNATSVSFLVSVAPGHGQFWLNVGDTKTPLRVYGPHLASTNEPFGLPSSVKGGTAIQATLTLRGVVANCGLAGHYKLRSSNPNLAQVPGEVVVPIGSSVGTFTITTAAVPTTQTVQIEVQASYPYCNANYGFRGETITLTP